MSQRSNTKPLFDHRHFLLLRRYIYAVALLVFIFINWSNNLDTLNGIFKSLFSVAYSTELSQREKNSIIPTLSRSFARFVFLFGPVFFVTRTIDHFEPRICKIHREVIRKNRRNLERLYSIEREAEIISRIEDMVVARVKDRRLIAEYRDALTAGMLKLESIDTSKSGKRQTEIITEPTIDLFSPKIESAPKPNRRQFVPNLLRRTKPPEF